MVLAAGQAGSDELRRARVGVDSTERDRQRKLDEEAKHDVMMMGLASMGIMGVIGVLMVSQSSKCVAARANLAKLFIAYMFGARFDLALEQIMAGNFTKQTPGRLQQLLQQEREL